MSAELKQILTAVAVVLILADHWRLRRRVRAIEGWIGTYLTIVKGGQ